MSTPAELAAFFARCSWPRALTQAERDLAFEALYVRRHEAHSYVCQRDEIADSWVGVMEGFLSVQDTTLEGKLVMYTGVAPGGWFGEGSLLKPEQRKYEAMATRPTVTVHLPRKTFGWLLEHSIPFNHFMLSHLNERLGQFIAMVKFDRLLEPTARAARGIAGLFHPVLYPNTDATLRINQEELGWLVGVSRQRVNTALTELEAAGLIRRGYGHLVVMDRQGLSRYPSPAT
ncbi:Crp/Fnr family transcriptional regulator [Pseudorhodoferax aquiterrae]|uniref:Crp/Fnr family transcriptional regulator n=1 Tax=Pseudorhodoferax aquiterrae TaxID=747304 RepID=A0ABQ3G8R9_9BURK|nr:Crp/Fnr family transcriptional regulator [Pseudorhodoferax aquiterrae]GHC95493.1 Crp/Fnr family transcriptional regulator [Pseudorhodoferax aquiterrae]